MTVLKIVGALVTLSGALFLLFGAIGLLRMPDCYTRIQAGTKATTLGTMLSMLGIGLYHPEWLGKLVLVILFILLTNPISSHALARAAHFIKNPMAASTVMDKLEESNLEERKLEERAGKPETNEEVTEQ